MSFRTFIQRLQKLSVFGIFFFSFFFYLLPTNVNLIKNNFVETAEVKEPREFLVHSSELEEKQSISLTCNAEVGRPRGNIQRKNFQNLKPS